MLTLTVKVGQAVQIGDAVCVGVDAKSGQSVKLTIATHIGPVMLIPSGIIPERFTMGVTGRREGANDNRPAHLAQRAAG